MSVYAPAQFFICSSWTFCVGTQVLNENNNFQNAIRGNTQGGAKCYASPKHIKYTLMS